MIIKVRTTQTTEKEINIEFPFVTFDKLENKYYYNSDENKCMILNLNTGSILNLHYSNEGFEFEQIKKELFFVAFDSNMQNLLNILNK
jgi:hypothetical protein